MTRPLHPTALVTGGNRGLGLAIARGLMARGVRVTIGAREAVSGFIRWSWLKPGARAQAWDDALDELGGVR